MDYERILNALITHISIYEGDFTTVGVTRLEMLAWLEKQKVLTRQPRDWSDADERMSHPLYLEGFDVGRKVGKIEAEQKPVSTEDMPYITDEHFFEREPVDSFKYRLAEYMTKCCTKKEGPYGYEYGISAESILQMAKEELIKRGELKEQKPAELSEEEYGRLFDIEHYLKGTLQLSPDRKIACIDFLKSLRPSWKPSEEQIRSLEYFIKLWGDSDGQLKYVKIFNDVKSLCEQLKNL